MYPTLQALRTVATMMFLLASVPTLATAELGEWAPLGPPGGSINRLAIDPVTPTTLYAGTEGGVFKSTDGGATWAEANQGLTAPGILRIVVDPLIPTTLYAATSSGGVFKSVDAAATWTPKNIGIGGFVPALAIDPANPATLYARANGGIVKTTNGAASWSPSNTGIPFSSNSRAIVVDPITTSTAYTAVVGVGVYKSVNGAASWGPSNAGLTDFDLTSLAVDPLSPSTLFVGTCGATPSRGLFKSIDGGASWTLSSTGLDPSPCVEAIACDPTLPGVVYASTNDAGAFKSVDGGATWTAQQAGVVGRRLFDFVIDPSDSATIYTASLGGGVFKSVDGGASWTPRNVGVHAYPIFGIAFDITAPGTLYLGSYSDETTETVFRSIDGGATWAPRGPVPNDPDIVEFGIYGLAVDPSAPMTIYAGGDSGLFKTTDGGLNWTDLPLFGFTTTVLIDPDDPATVYAASEFDYGVAKSTDGGATWVDATTGLTDLSVASLVMSRQNPRVLYAATRDGVFRTTNGGGTWSPRTTGMGPLAVGALGIDPTDADVLYAGTLLQPTRLFTSTDGGAQWTDHGNFNSVEAFAVDPARPATVYAAGTFGVLKSSDAGATWGTFDVGFVDRRVQAIALDPAASVRVFAGTLGSGAYVSQSVCLVDGDCDDDDLCTTDTCAPDDPAADGDGCVIADVQCDPQCHEQPGFCNGGTGLCEYFSPALPNGTPCDDDDACTFDRCIDGVCTGNPVPQASCRKALSSRVLLKDSPTYGKDLITWKWTKGAATTVPDLAEPRAGAQYTLCVYDRSGPGGDPALILRAQARPSGICAGLSCWTLASGYKYRDREALPDGLTNIRLKAGPTGAAKITLKGKGVNLAMPSLSLTPAVTVQLAKTHGWSANACWDADYSTVVLRNDSQQFKAKGD